MILQHVALTCSSEKKSDRFYKNLLGLENSGSKMLSKTLSKAIFNIEAELLMINYRSQQLHFEIFIAGDSENSIKQITHVCLEVEDLETFLKKCQDLDVEVSQIPRGDRTLTFIRDYDGNLFELKQKQPNE
jgi:catechol 2,3-dioxygenase-like lactoylglutathione lyase family enzyme